MMATATHSTLIRLQQHVRYYMAREHDADEYELVDDFLDALDLDPEDYLAILEEYRRQKRAR
jgi:hypothetical protein